MQNFMLISNLLKKILKNANFLHFFVDNNILDNFFRNISTVVFEAFLMPRVKFFKKIVAHGSKYR